MHLRDVIVWAASIILAGTLLITAGTRLDYINSQRQEMKLISNEPLKNAPPSLAFATVAMGAFRGLVVDVLWMRADKLKEQGQFFDARQLAEWITTLQPRFASVWEFHAWNMAYNISVAIPANQPDQRWRWVKNGYELLRDQGIPLNPKAIQLYRELARIFQHKMGGVSDDAHKYYKLQLALAMEPLLQSEDNQLDSQDKRYFEALAKEAHTTWQHIVQDANVAGLIAALKAADNEFADDDKFVSNYLSLRQNASRFKPQAGTVIDDFRGTGQLKKFDIFAKAYHLRNTWKLDPVLMRELNNVYGPTDVNDPNRHYPLDWRHPDSHAIYWAVKGLREVSKDEAREIDIKETNTDRMVGHSLQNLFRNGKIFIYDAVVESSDGSSSQPIQKTTKQVFLRPDLRMFQPYNQAVLAVLEKYKGIGEGTYESLQNGHRNMLKNAAFLFYQTGHRQQAREIYKQLGELYPLQEFKVPLVVFARKRFLEELESIGIFDAKEQIIALLREGYFRFALRDDNAAFGREKLAQEIWDYYMSQYDDPEYRIDLPPLPRLKYMALFDFINDPWYPPNLRQSLLNRIQIERPKLYEQLRREEELFRQETQEST